MISENFPRNAADLPTPHEESLLREQIADLEPYLYPGVTVINVEHPPILKPTNRISAIKAFYRIDNATKRSDVGENGPVVAAVSTEANKGLEDLHLYNVLFGRDSLRVSLDLLDIYPALAHSTILQLAALQGTMFNPRSGEEPGRIIHESRNPKTDERACELSKEHGWDWPYYESIDATPMFITAIKRYCKQEGDGLLDEHCLGRGNHSHTVGNCFRQSIDWLCRRLDESPRGFLESHREMGLASESWRDSADAFSHSSGELANLADDLAPLDVQVLAYDALLDAAYVFERYLIDPERSAELKRRAESLKQKILKKFWVEDFKYFGGYFCIGLDYDENGQSRQLQIRSSDMGHLLNSRLLDGDRPEIVAKKESIIRNLFSNDMLCASGIRTLAKTEKRFNPVGYQTGSVWLWDTYYIAQGLERHGYYGLSEELKLRSWRVADATNLLPEFAQGGDDPEPRLNTRIVDVWDPNMLDKKWDGKNNILVRGAINRIEQPPQEIQAWSVAAILASKFKRDPLHPKKAVPLQASESVKLVFEKSILENL